MTYRNAIITLSQRGWRRNEPGLVTAVEQPSMLPRSTELLEESGIPRESLVDQARAPRDLFDIAIARIPRFDSGDDDAEVGSSASNVIPLLTGRTVSSD